MVGREDALEVARRIHALSGGGELQRLAAARELARRHPAAATELLNELLGLKRDGFYPASCVLQLMLQALTVDAHRIPYAHALKRVADLQALSDVTSLFAEGPPMQELDPGTAKKRDALAFSDTLGHLKTKARATRDRDQLVKLLAMANPHVVQNALLNPHTTEDLVVRAAAKRPTRPEALLEIARSPRWSVLRAVQRALVFNPYLPPEVGAKLVPLLSDVDLAELESYPSVHPSLRDQARRLLAREKDALR